MIVSDVDVDCMDDNYSNDSNVMPNHFDNNSNHSMMMA